MTTASPAQLGPGAAPHLQPGAEWTFCHSDGRRTAYILDSSILEMYRLLNPATGRYAHVSLKWLLEGRVGCGSYWTPGAIA